MPASRDGTGRVGGGRASTGAIVLAACLGASATGCGLLLGVSSWQDVACVDSCSDAATDTSANPPDATTDTSDGAAAESSPGETGSDAGDSGVTTDAMDSGTLPDADAGNPYHPVNDNSFWTRFDVSALDGGPKGFAGGAFDGRYVYLAPHDNGSPDGLVTRLDTESDAGFANRASWQTFDTTTIDGGAGAAGFLGAVYDPTGKQLYLVPSNDGVPDGVVASYSTTKPFAQASSWAAYAPVVDAGGNTGFAGGAMAGSSLILVPNDNGAPDGLVTRLDTTMPFASAASWSAFNVTQKQVNAKSFFGAVDTPQLMIFAPAGAAAPSGLVAAYQTAQPFSASGSWLTWNVSALPGGTNAVDFRGAAYDGQQFAYLIPNKFGVVAQYDTHQPFASSGAWLLFDVTANVNGQLMGFYGGAFDGRYLYLIPNTNTVLVRYDTTAPFAKGSSWTTYDLGVGSGPFAGAVFDGEYLYLVPATNGVVTRFDARSPALLPAGLTGSFF